jgi:HEAT repeat protein
MGIIEKFFGPPNIAKLKQTGNIQRLMQVLSSKVNLDIQIEAALALCDIGDSKVASEAIKFLMNNELSESESVKRKASEALSKIKQPRFSESLIALLSEKQFVFKAVEFLGEIKNDHVWALLQALSIWNGKLRFGMWQSLWTVVELLFLRGNTNEGMTAALSVKDQLNDTKNMEITIINSLNKIGDFKIIKPLLDVLEYETLSFSDMYKYTSEKPDFFIVDNWKRQVKHATSEHSEAVCQAILNAMVQQGIRDSSALDLLIEALKDERQIVRQKTVKALGEIKNPRAVEPLIFALRDDDSSIREEATRALEKIRPQKDYSLKGCFGKFYEYVESGNECSLCTRNDSCKTASSCLGKFYEYRDKGLCSQCLQKNECMTMSR